MATINKYEEIVGWQKARELTKFIYALSGQGKFTRDFGLKDQIRRAAVSIMSNIAEGFERGGTGEFIQFLSIAKGSVGEVITQLHIAYDLKYLDYKEFEHLINKATGYKISRLFCGSYNILLKFLQLALKVIDIVLIFFYGWYFFLL